MKKTLNVVLAVILAVAMIASFAYVATPEKSNDYQLSLVSAKAVNVQDTATGVRSYADLVDTDRIYQVNEVIYLAITTEVKNLEKYPKLKSIEGKTIEVIVGSPSIDLSYSKLTHPTLLGNVWSGYTAVNVATVGYLSPAGTMLKYDKNANEITYKFRGVEMYGMGGSAAHNSDYMHLVTFDPKYNSSKEWIEIPAIKLKNKTASWVLGGQTFDAKYEAPDAIAYTMVLTGVTKDNNGAQKGTFYAKLLISGAEKFEDHSQYYLVGWEGRYAATEAEAKKVWKDNNQAWKYAEPMLWRDYVKVDVDILEIAGGYTVYKYFIPSSAVMNFVDFEYDGELDAQNGNNGHGSMADFGIRLGSANPNLFDNATKFQGKMGEDLIDVAGGVRSVKAFATYADYKAGAAKKEFPLTSVVYVNNAPIYAPGFYGGDINWGGAGTAAGGGTNSTDPVEGGIGTGVNTATIDVVDYYSMILDTKDEVDNFRWQDIQLLWANNITTNAGADDMFTDAANIGNGYNFEWDWYANNGFQAYDAPGAINLDPTKVMKDPNGNDFYQMISLGNGKYEVRLYPAAALKAYVLPLNKKTPVANTTDVNGYVVGSMIAYYRNQYSMVTDTVARANGFASKTAFGNGGGTFVNPQSATVATAYPGSQQEYFKTFNEVTKKLKVSVNTVGFDFIGFTSWNGKNTEKVDLKTIDQIPTGADSSRIYLCLTGNETATQPVWTGPNTSVGSLTYKMKLQDLRTGFPSAATAQTLPSLDFDNLAVALSTAPVGGSFGMFQTPFGSTAAGTGGGQSNLVIGYKTLVLSKVNGKDVITATDFYAFDKDYPAQGWYPIDVATDLATLNAGVNSFNTTNGADGTLRLWTEGEFTFYKEGGTDSAPYYWYYDNADALSKAAPTRLWETGDDSIVVDHNGIVFYSIQSFEDEIPKIGIASEKTYFDSEDGYGICLFDGMSNAYGVQFIGQRIYRSNDSNLAYSRRQTHVEDSSSKIAALRYFDLDTSFNTIWKVLPEQFEAKGAAAVYSEAIEGEFKYGVITIVPDPLDEGAETSEAPMDEESEAPEESEEVTEDVSEDVEEDTPEPTEKAQPVPPTGDASVNVAIALAAAAVVAAAGLAFVMKKVR